MWAYIFGLHSLPNPLQSLISKQARQFEKHCAGRLFPEDTIDIKGFGKIWAGVWSLV